MKLKSVIAGIALVLSSANVVSAQHLPLDSTVKVGELENGFRYYIKENRYPEKRAVLYLANKVGSILEEEQERGLAHFLEHMNFKGTKHFPKNQLIDYLEKAGVKFGADLNAYTSFDETIYQLPIPTDNSELWNNGLQIMRDWAAEATLDKNEFESERGVILEEKRLQQNASGRLREQYMPSIYNYSRYAERAPIGLEEVIAKADIQVLKDFYTRWYRPDLQALIIVGDIDAQAVENQVKKLFGDLQKDNTKPERPTYDIPLIDSLRFIQAKDKEFSQYLIEYFVKRKKTPVTTEEDFKQDLVRQLFNNLFATRLQEISRRGSSPYLGVQVSSGGFVSDLEMLNVRIALSPDKWEEGFKAAWTELLRVAWYGFDEAELNDVKERFNSQIALLQRERDKVASSALVEEYLQYFLNGDRFLSLETKLALRSKYLKEISAEDIQKYLLSFLQEKDRTFLVMGADKEGVILPEKTQLLQWIATTSNSKIEPYLRDNQQLSLFDEEPTAGKLVKQDSIPTLGLSHWKLSNGIEVYAKPTTNRNDEILFTGFSQGGSSLYGDEDYYSTINAATFIVNSGLGKLNANQLSQFLNAKALQVMPYISEREEGISGASTGKDLETALTMVHLYMTDTKLDTARFSVIMDRSKTAMRSRVDDPKSAFADTVGNVLGNYHYRRQPNSLATLEQIKADRVQSIFKERFVNAGDFKFVFVGNFHLDSLKVLTEKYLGSLPSTGDREEARDLKIRVPEGKIRKDLFLGEGDKGTVQMVYSGTYKFNAANNRYLDALKAAIAFRLTERLRKQESGVYSPAVQLTKAKQPIEFYAFTVSFDCDPTREEAMIAAVRDELHKISQDGINQDELDKFVAEEIRSIELQAKSNQFWLSYLKGQLDKNEPLEDFLSSAEEIKKIKLPMVNQLARELLNQKNEIIVTLSPERK